MQVLLKFLHAVQPAEICWTIDLVFLGESFGGLGGEVDLALKKFGQSRLHAATIFPAKILHIFCEFIEPPVLCSLGLHGGIPLFLPLRKSLILRILPQYGYFQCLYQLHM